MRLIDYFRRAAGRNRQASAWVDAQGSLSWEQTEEHVERVAAAFAALGLAAGDRIAVYSPNDRSAFIAILAIFRLGGVWVPVNARNHQPASEHWLTLCGCQALVYHSSLESEALALHPLLSRSRVMLCLDREGVAGAPSLESLRLMSCPGPASEPPDGADVVANLFPTGGTTGLSRAAQWSLLTWEALVDTFWRNMPCADAPVHLVAGPMTHAAGVLAFCAMAEGATNVILGKPRPEVILDAIETHRVTHLYLPPTAIYMLLDHPGVRKRDFSSLRYLLIAASPIAPARLREAMDVFGPVVCQCYGQAEAPMFLTFLSSRDLLEGPEERWSSCGRPTAAVELEIMGSHGELLGSGRKGELVARGDLTMPGYYGNADATAAITTEGWRRTGDIGFRDEQGFIYIVDRAKDMIITGGFNVFSVEVEQVILEHPAVLDCAVIGVPDPKWGEAVRAIVELKGGVALDESGIIGLVRHRLGPIHAPKKVEAWPSLPRSPAGKVLKADIRERYWRGRSRGVG